jgi:hypothetical protein
MLGARLKSHDPPDLDVPTIGVAHLNRLSALNAIKFLKRIDSFLLINLLGLALKARPTRKALFVSFFSLVILVASGDASVGYSLQHFLYAAGKLRRRMP